MEAYSQFAMFFVQITERRTHFRYILMILKSRVKKLRLA